MKNLKVSAAVERKLEERHQVTRRDVEQCFSNRAGRLLEDKRARHKTNPPTLWFIACTNRGRRLKIVYIQTGMLVDLKSAFEPNEEEERIYAKYGA